jgi:hypothetical protein
MVRKESLRKYLCTSSSEVTDLGDKSPNIYLLGLMSLNWWLLVVNEYERWR